jgi:hypothetical protein
VPTFADRRCKVVSLTDPYGRILGFSRQDPLLFLPNSSSIVLTECTPFKSHYSQKSGSAGNLTRTSGSVVRNSDHETTYDYNYDVKEDEIKRPCSTKIVEEKYRQDFGCNTRMKKAQY